MKNKITMKEVFVNDFYSDDWSEGVMQYFVFPVADANSVRIRN